MRRRLGLCAAAGLMTAFAPAEFGRPRFGKPSSYVASFAPALYGRPYANGEPAGLVRASGDPGI